MTRGVPSAVSLMRIPVEDLAILGGYFEEAYLEAKGRKRLEVSPDKIELGDTIEGLGEVTTKNYMWGMVIFDLGNSVQIMFRGDPETATWPQLVDITRAINRPEDKQQ